MNKWIVFISIFFLSFAHAFSQCTPFFTYQADTNRNVTFTNQTPPFTSFTYEWDFGDGSPIDSTFNANHYYANNGMYIVSLKVDSHSIPCGTFIDTIYVNYCYASFSKQTNFNVVQFQNNSATSSNSHYSWDFGDGNYSTQKNPTHTYQFAGQYAVWLNTYDSLSGCSALTIDSVYITAPPCGAGFNYTINNDTLFVQNQASNYHLISYDFGDSTTSSAENPIHIYQQSGTYMVCQTVIDTVNNCTDTYCDTVNIFIPPPCDASFSHITNNDTLFVQNLASNYQLISYDFGDGNGSTNANPTHIYQQSGSYLVCQTVTDTANNCTDTFCDSVTITIPPACKAGFTSRIHEDSIFIQNTASNYQIVNYDFGDGNTSTLENPMHVYSQSGSYILCQTVEDTLNNCLDTFCDSVSIVIPSPCQAGFTHQFQNDTSFFLNTASNYDSLIYFFGDGASSTLENPVHMYANSGEYVIEQKVFNHRNCISIFKDTIQVTISTSCVANFELALDTSQPSVLFLISKSSNFPTQHYFWDFGDGNTSTQRKPIHQYAENKAYPICLTVSDSTLNCISTYCDTVGLDTNGNILKSNGFTLRVLDGSIGLKEKHNPLEKLVIYPNPTVESITLKWPVNINELSYELYNIQGQIVQSGMLQRNGNTSIELSHYENGMYMIQFKTNEYQLIRKIIKQ